MAECNEEVDHIKFNQFYKRIGDFFTDDDEPTDYDYFVAMFINFDLNGDGRLTKLEMLNRARAVTELEKYELGGQEYPYEGIQVELFRLMDQKYVYDNVRGYYL